VVHLAGLDQDAKKLGDFPLRGQKPQAVYAISASGMSQASID